MRPRAVKFLLLSGFEPRALGHPRPSLVTNPTELSPLQTYIYIKDDYGKKTSDLYLVYTHMRVSIYVG